MHSEVFNFRYLAMDEFTLIGSGEALYIYITFIKNIYFFLIRVDDHKYNFVNCSFQTFMHIIHLYIQKLMK